MAIYEYRCDDCGAQFEARRAMRDADSPIECPECGSMHTRRGLSLFFSRSAGEKARVSAGNGGGSACASCSASSCASCGH